MRRGINFMSSARSILRRGLTRQDKSGLFAAVKGSKNLIRIALQNMLVLVRLVIVASLACYSLPAVSLAMHGDISSSYATAPDDSDHHAMPGGHMAMEMDHHEHGAADQSASHHDKPVKQDCCSDFCMSAAIVAESPILASHLPASIRAFTDDESAFGELTSLQRPPSIRA
jgi:hypothetical protein